MVIVTRHMAPFWRPSWPDLHALCYHPCANGLPRDVNGNIKLSGKELLDHMCRFYNVEHAKKADPGDSARMEPARGLHVKRKTNNLGAIVGNATVVNSEENMEKIGRIYSTICITNGSD